MYVNANMHASILADTHIQIRTRTLAHIHMMNTQCAYRHTQNYGYLLGCWLGIRLRLCDLLGVELMVRLLELHVVVAPLSLLLACVLFF